MDDLVVNNEFATTVIDNKGSDTASTIIEGSGDLVVETTLINNREALLNITALSHTDDSAILSQIKDSVLLEDRSEHALDDD